MSAFDPLRTLAEPAIVHAVDPKRITDLDEMLAKSRELIREMQADLAEVPGPQPICHHFSNDDVDWGTDEEQRYLKALIPALSARGLHVDVIGGPFGVEGWENFIPNEDWLLATVPALWAIGQEAGCPYDGWSWEPKRT